MWNLKTSVNLLTDKRVSFFKNCGVPWGGGGGELKQMFGFMNSG